MRDELSHIRNISEEKRSRVLAKHSKLMEQIHTKYPALRQNTEDIQRVKKSIITKTLAKFRGQALDHEICELENSLEGLRNKRKELLGQYKIDPKSLEPQWECSECQDTGRIYIDDDQFVACKCRRVSRLEVLKTTVSLPVRLAGASFDNVNYNLYSESHRAQAKKLFQLVERYCQDQIKVPSGKGLFIHGPTGSGKSWMLGCVANHLLGNMSVKYLVYADFLDSLRATFNSRDNGSSEQQMIDDVKNAGLLLLDDLGVERPTEFALKYLAQIIDYRYRNCLPIVVTSNFTLEELRNRTQNDLYGERIVWRLIESCGILNLEGNTRLNL